MSALAASGCTGGRVAALDDREFWRLSESLSEPAGAFALSDNFLSNEPRIAENARWVRPRGGVYVGVGPEQNFTYIAAGRPAIAFIVDIRRENRDLQLLYKALFEIAADRADFVSRLFSRPRPAGVDRSTSADDLFSRLVASPMSPALLADTRARVRERLAAHALPLAPNDFDVVDRVLDAFAAAGPAIEYWEGRADAHSVHPTYRELMTSRDLTGTARSFLADEEGFAFVKTLEMQNLIVPVVGDFGGPTAIRAVGRYVREHRQQVRAFYGSNVAVYLSKAQTRAFCASLATLPVSGDAVFVDRDGVRTFASKLKACG